MKRRKRGDRRTPPRERHVVRRRDDWVYAPQIGIKRPRRVPVHQLAERPRRIVESREVKRRVLNLGKVPGIAYVVKRESRINPRCVRARSVRRRMFFKSGGSSRRRPVETRKHAC